MKKLSILAAGVAVLSMCACTEANEFTPSTNNSTKKITEIKVSANPSALGSRTEFDTSNDKYGVVTWEDGKDQLYFFKPGDRSNYQIFTCGKNDTQDDNYDWNYFNTSGAGGHETGLNVGDNYYAYYFPGKYIDKDVLTKYYANCLNFTVYRNHGTTDENKILKEFMQNYDLLMSDDVILAEDPMPAIKMEHAFALVAVQLRCEKMGSYTNFDQLPTFYQTELVASDENGHNAFETTFTIDDVSGQLTWSTVDGQAISSGLDTHKYYGVNEDQTLSFYFLVRQKNPTKTLRIDIDTEAYTNSEEMGNVDKFVEIEFKDEVKFLPGNIYHFGLKIDYTNYEKNTPRGFDYETDWQLYPGQIKLDYTPDAEGFNKVVKVENTEVG